MSVFIHMSYLSHTYVYARVKFCVYLGRGVPYKIIFDVYELTT